MQEISIQKNMFLKNTKNNDGIALLVTILLMSLILFLSLYFLTFSLNENRIANSQTLGTKTYYLAEAGIAEMVWKLKNNSTYQDNFENNPSWTMSFTHDDPFGLNSGSYTVNITNSNEAHAEIVSTGSINLGSGKNTQRVIRTYVYKALGQTGLEDKSGYADGNIDISGSIVNFYNGSAHSNNVFTVNGGSFIYVESDLNAAGNYLESWTSSSNILGSIYAANYPPAAEEVDMPAIDFDSIATSSLKNRADIIYSSDDFEDLMWDNQNLILNNNITYVEGDVEIKGAQTLTINGLLVIERDLEVGVKNNWKSRSGSNSIIVNHASGTPSGILVGRQINIKEYTNTINATGVIYANDQINIINIQPGISSFDIVGGLVSRKLTITSSWQPINITHDNNILMEVFEATEYSPIILVEHWEEEY